MNTSVSAFDQPHQLSKPATRPIVGQPGRLAALLVVAGSDHAPPRALPDNPAGPHSDSFNRGFKDYRLFELYNLELWPLQIPALALGVAVLALWQHGGEAAGRGIALILALCWLRVAWRFHWLHYASINPFARYVALACALQALLLFWLGAVRGRLTPLSTSRLQRAGLGILAFAVLLFPLLGRS